MKKTNEDKKNKKQWCGHFDEELYNEIKASAHQQRTSMNWIVNAILEQYYNPSVRYLYSVKE